MDLFASADKNLPDQPLTEKIRPQLWTDLAGQEKVLRQIKRYIQSKYLPNLIFWGPPGTGKTTLALALAREFEAEFVSLNAVDSGAKVLKEVGESAQSRRRQYQKRTILFVDEIHRFNKAQQDVLLPFVEKGELTLIGATTENPSYELNRALLSRCRLLVFERLGPIELAKVLEKAFVSEGLNLSLVPAQAQDFLINWCDGDARRILLAADEVIHWLKNAQKETVTVEDVADIVGTLPLGYDKKSEQHYDVVSAFIKSIRGSDADAALYYLARMLKGGEDPTFIARRLVILASEDVGNADPRALQVAVAGMHACEMIGMPEGAINLSQVVTYLASAPKSNRSYVALKKAEELLSQTGTLEIPLHLRSSKAKEMKQLGYGKEYLYPHDHPKAWIEQSYWPESVPPTSFYEPSDLGFEKNIKEYSRWLKSPAKDKA